MEDKQFNIICEKLDKLIAFTSISNVTSSDDKIYILKNMGLNSSEISPIVKIKNVRDTKGWKRK